jgi:Flp pilus assembly CpaF family ATPase
MFSISVASDLQAFGSEMMARYLGPAIVRAFGDDDVTEIYVNPQDGMVRLDTRSRGRVESGVSVAPHRVEMFLNAVATGVGLTLSADVPRLEAELPVADFQASRLQGFVPPITSAPAFTIRKPARVVYSLDDFATSGVITGGQRAQLLEVTTLFPSERIVVLEDTVELRCAAADHLALRTRPGVSLADLVRSALRTSPSRLVVGEVRGNEALDLLDAWATGHPGGVATVHASSVEGALLRLDRLAQRANVPPQRELVAEAIHWVAVLEGGNAGRRLTDLARVRGLGPGGGFIVERESRGPTAAGVVA